MKFTKHARKLLDSLPDDRKAEVGNYAKALALDEGTRSIQKHHVVGAVYLAGPEFLPGEDDD